MRLDNGTIMILGPDVSNIGRKVFDLKIMQTFPIISIDRGGSRLLSRKAKEIPIDEYDHLSIPPDLNLHLTRNTGNKRYLKFRTELVDYKSGLLKVDLLHLFTWMSSPVSLYREPRGTWHQAQLIFPPKDSRYSNSTSIFVDFFVHNYPCEDSIKNYKLFDSAMRLVGDNSGYIVGPYEFSQLVRGNHKFSPKFLFSLRFGFYENEEGHSTIYVPFKIEGDIMVDKLFLARFRKFFGF